MTEFLTAPVSLAHLARQYTMDVESWKLEHNRAMRCLDLEHVLETGLVLFRRLVEMSNEVLKPRPPGEDIFVDLEKVRVSDGQVSREKFTNPDPIEGARIVAAVMATWMRPCNDVLAELTLLETEGYTVKYAEEFRRAAGQAAMATRWEKIRAAAQRFKHTSGSTPDEIRAELLT